MLSILANNAVTFVRVSFQKQCLLVLTPPQMIGEGSELHRMMTEICVHALKVSFLVCEYRWLDVLTNSVMEARRMLRCLIEFFHEG